MSAPLVRAVAAVGLAIALLACGQKTEVDQQAATPASTAAEPSSRPDTPKATQTRGGLIGTRRPDFALPDVDGTVRAIGEWDGKVMVVNFWATWCPPCRREMPAFVELQETYGERGLQFVGVAIDDQDKVQDFIDTLGVNYPILIGGLEAIDAAKRYGNRFGALPYTVVVDRQGNIALTHRGELSRELAESTISGLL